MIYLRGVNWKKVKTVFKKKENIDQYVNLVLSCQ